MVRWGTAVATVIGLARATTAQPADQFSIERFQVAIDDTGVLDVDGAAVPDHLMWSAGTWTGFAHDPLVAYTTDNSEIKPIIDRRLSTGLYGSIGLWDRLAIGISTTVTDYQHGDSSVMGSSTGGLGDVRLTAKIPFYRHGAWRFAFVPMASIPAGGGSGFLREDGPTFTPQLAASATFGNLRGAANLGYRFRDKLAVAGLQVDDEVLARAAIGYRIAAGTELAGSMSLASPASDLHRNQIAIELLLGGSSRFPKSLAPKGVELDAFGAAGIGLDNGFGTPDWRIVAGVRVEKARSLVEDRRIPEDLDPDHDGILGAADKCPNEPEDKDGFQDADGCPDPDNDGDGIPDVSDKCPNEPEDKDGFQDADGCPDPAVAVDGRVVDADVRPIVGAAVHVEAVDAGTAFDLTTDATGTFHLMIEGDAVKVTATAPDYQPTTVEHRASAGALEIVLTRKVRQGQLRGQVQSFDGKPLAATIKVTGAATANATADAGGRFSVDLGAGKYEVEIEAAGYVTQRRTVTVKLDGVTVLNADLRAKSGP